MLEEVTGDIARIIRNDAGLYEGNLIPYFRAVFYQAQNLRHMLHVLWLCYDAIAHYADRMAKYERRSLLIGALIHDFDHSGQPGDDDLNIERALRGLRRHLQPEDHDYGGYIGAIIAGSEFPHKVPSDQLCLPAQILRDADVMQALSTAWIQQVVIGLATEWSKPPIEVLRAQKGFHRSMRLHTDWAKHLVPPEKVQAKVAEAEALLELLGDPPKYI